MAAHKAHADEIQTYYFANLGARFAAWFIDGIILFVGVLVLSIVLGFGFPNLFGLDDFARGTLLSPYDSPTIGVFLVMFFWLGGGIFYHTAMVANYGQTLGKMICGVKVLTVDGAMPSWGTSFLRAVCAFLLSRQILWLGYIWAFFQPQHQSWHDMIARTFVVKA